MSLCTKRNPYDHPTQRPEPSDLVGFAPLFQDGAILQCEQRSRVWGFGRPGNRVGVELASSSVAATATVDAQGEWLLELPPQPSGGPHSLLLKVDDILVEQINDIWFGEVWLASGQSNMDWPLSGTAEGDAFLGCRHANIRVLRMPGRFESVKLSEDTALNWLTPEGEAAAHLPAVPCHFADIIQESLNRKVGILAASYGGSKIEAWLSPESLRSDPQFRRLSEAAEAARLLKTPIENWQAEVDAFEKWYHAMEAWRKNPVGPEPARPPLHPGNPRSAATASVFFNAMIRPFLPYSARGAIWYQGESNTDEPTAYRSLFSTLIREWRACQGKKDWPFYFVQLAGHQGLGDWPALRESQRTVRDTIPGTGMAVTLDCGDPDNIHPSAKRPVGERLARLALRNTYHLPIPDRGPSPTEVSVGKGTLTVHFTHCEEGLHAGSSIEQNSFSAVAPTEGVASLFEVAGKDELFQKVSNCRIEGDRVILEHNLAEPRRIRYAYQAWPNPAFLLFNSAGLPAEPFIQSVTPND